jgi:hypothetical protein
MYKFDSDEEGHFASALQQLQANGYIKSWHYHPKPFILSEKVTYNYKEILKTKTNDKEGFLLHPHSYQADFLIYWNSIAEHIFFASLSNNDQVTNYPFIANGEKSKWSVIDVKGTFAGPHNNSAISFPLDQKWVYQKYNIYVQKIIPVKLFAKTFTPDAFLKTPTGKAKKINFKVRSLKQYIDNFNKVL